MKCLLLGYSKLDMTADDGKQITGTHMYIAHPQPNCTGNACRKIFINNTVYLDIVKIDVDKFVGKELNIDVDFNGKPSSIYA